MAKREKPDYNTAFDNPLSKSNWDIKEPPEYEQPPTQPPKQAQPEPQQQTHIQTHAPANPPANADVHDDTHVDEHAHIDVLFAAKKPKKTIRKHFLCEKEIDSWLSSTSKKLDVTEGEIIRMALYRLKEEMNKRKE